MNTNEMAVVSYHNSTAEQTAILVSTGRKYHTLLLIESAGVVCRKVAISEEKHFTPLLYKGNDYPLKKAVNRYLGTARRMGCTKSARRAMKELKEAI